MPEYLVALSAERLIRVTATHLTEAREKAETKANKDGNYWSAVNAWPSGQEK
jgi:nitrous oxidase accessory protein NosD